MPTATSLLSSVLSTTFKQMNKPSALCSHISAYLHDPTGTPFSRALESPRGDDGQSVMSNLCALGHPS